MDSAAAWELLYRETDLVEAELAAIERYLNQMAIGIVPCGDVEGEFLQHILRYSVRNGITELAWLEMGVPDDVLQRAGYYR